MFRISLIVTIPSLCVFKVGSFPMPSRNSDTSITSLNKRVDYGMASEDLSAKWLELVQKDQVAVTTTIPSNDDDDGAAVRYGVRMDPHSQDSFMEFIESKEDADDALTSSLQFRYKGNYVAQLQLVRTLRPPPSPGVAQSNNDFRTSSRPPPYNSETDSLVTGPLRLQLRPKVASLSLPELSTNWDVYHNISPADVRGHFLLLPTIDATDNWRGQALIRQDCHDLVHLTASVRPMGSLMTCFNSVGAGAGQNHIHCHLWPAPPIPLIHKRPKEEEDSYQDEEDGHDHSHSHSHSLEAEDDDDLSTTHNGWNCYAPSRVESIFDFVDIGGSEHDDPMVEASYLNYPCFCVQLSSNSASHSLDPLGKALWKVLSCLGDAPYNVCMINRPSNRQDKDNNGSDVDVFVFARSRERSPHIVPASKAGASEMMGVFHCHNLQQLEELVAKRTDGKPTMAQLLEDVSHEDPLELWDAIKEKLEGMNIMEGI